MDALRLLRVNLGLLNGDDCEIARAFVCAANSAIRVRYLQDAFGYARCAKRIEQEAFVRGLKQYARAVFEKNQRASSAFSHEFAHVFGKWTRRLDVGLLYAVCV
jgi:hypothetical protein